MSKKKTEDENNLSPSMITHTHEHEIIISQSAPNSGQFSVLIKEWDDPDLDRTVILEFDEREYKRFIACLRWIEEHK